MSIQFFLRLCRTAFRSKGLTFINIFGLGTGLAVALFLLVYLQFEFSYDRHFKEADRIYRMLSVWKEGGEAENYPINLGALSSSLVNEAFYNFFFLFLERHARSFLAAIPLSFNLKDNSCF